MDDEFEFESGFSPAGAGFPVGWTGEIDEMEDELRRRRGFAPRPVRAPPRGRMPPPRSRRPLPPRRPPVRIVRPYRPGPWPVVEAPLPTAAAPDAERVRWLQDCLNQVEGLRLPISGTMDAATRSALRRFQSRSGLRASGIAGPDTEDALQRACGDQSAAEPQQENSLDWMIAPPPPLPHFSPLQPLATTARSAAGAGVYILFKGKQPFYVGETVDFRRRLLQHLWCLTHMAVDAATYFAKVAPMAGKTKAERKAVESALIAKWRLNLTNVKTRELEEEMRGAGVFDSEGF